ncbi:MAG: pilus assembly PilX N-terminal domain-containing protein [Candidatus Kaelpia imicola]|nr:pilus assembly PilX N-terminal domain-containing protein [Candidatus Kaelpia imicola]
MKSLIISRPSILETDREKGAVLILVVAILMVVFVLALALIMLSTSQEFLSSAQKEDLEGFYIAEAQIQWAALKLRSASDYTGGSSGSDIYEPDDADLASRIEKIKIVVELEDGGYEDIDNALWTIKAYIEFKEKLQKKSTIVRVDADLEKRVSIITDGKQIDYEITNWREIRPPEEP